MMKWLWKLLTDNMSIALQVLENRYGNLIKGLLYGMEGLERELKSSSLWWRDLWELVKSQRGVAGFVFESFELKIETGSKTLFWQDKWCGSLQLKEVFPRLYGVASNKCSVVNELGFWEGNEWKWNLGWRRPLFVWEEELEKYLISLIGGISFQRHRVDRWIWSVDKDGVYSSKVGYSTIIALRSPPNPLSVESLKCLNSIWNSWAPSKCKVFSWQVPL
jgi:hypothetical protein